MKNISKIILLLIISGVWSFSYSQPKEYFARKNNYFGLFSNDQVTKLNYAFETKKVVSKDDAKMQKYIAKADRYYKMSNLPLSDTKIKRYKRKTYKYDLKAAKIKLPIIGQYIQANNNIKSIYATIIDTVKNVDTCILKVIKKQMQPFIDTANQYKTTVTSDPVQTLANLENYYFYDNKVIVFMEYQLAVIAKDSNLRNFYLKKYCKPKVKVIKPKYEPEKDSFLFVTKAPKLDLVLKYTPSEKFTITQHPQNGNTAFDIIQTALKLNDTIAKLEKKADTIFDPFQKSIIFKNKNLVVREQSRNIFNAIKMYYLSNRNYFYCRESHTTEFFDLDSNKYKEPKSQRFLIYSQAYFSDARSLYDSAMKDTNLYNISLISKANKQTLTALEYQENFYLYFMGMDTIAVISKFPININSYIEQQKKQQISEKKQQLDTTKKVTKDIKVKKDDKKKTVKQPTSNKVVGIYEYSFTNTKPQLVHKQTGTSYRIYVGQTKYILPVNELKDYGTIYYETFANTELKYFYVGNFVNKDEASKQMNELKTKGYPVKLVKFVDGKRTDIEYSNNALNNSPQTQRNNAAIDVSTTKSLIYLVQIGTYSTEKTINDFSKIQTLYLQKLNDGRFQYYTEKTFTYVEAQKKLQSIKSKGYSDAIIVAFNNGKQTNLENAQNFENKLRASEIVYFRVQVGAFSSKLTDEQISQKYGKLKDFRLDSHNKNNMIIYTVGNSTSYEEAKNTLEKIKLLGYKDAFIIALKNNIQIPLDKAIK